MPSYSDIEKKRIAQAEAAQAETSAVVRILQQAAYGLFVDWLTGKIETDGGRIKYTARNFGAVQGIYRIFDRFFVDFQKTMLGQVLDWAGKIAGLNDAYFGTFEEPAQNVEDAALNYAMRRWGYNPATKELIAGGYFEALFSNRDIARRVAALTNRAIASKMSLAEFQRTFKSVFVGKPGQGMLERHWKTNSFDLFQRIDRAANLYYADRLGLEYAIYSGTLEDDSRPFCIERVNQVFSREEIAGWSALQFQGKPKIGYDPFTDCGGFNCRHHLSFISNEIAAHLRPELAK